MKKLAVKILLSFFLFVLLPTMVLAMQNGQSDVNAQTNSNTQSQSGQQNSVKNSTTSDDDSTSDSATTQQNRNENQINNPETGEMTQERIRLEIEECQPAYVPDNATSSVRKKMVEETIDSLIQLSYSIENSDTGTQIRAIAKAQGEAENKANQAIDDSKRSAVGQL
ncbi:MAG: hypothetical protein PHW50_03360, partial [Patescibacteria group bacterium]|nr:hypothetical protein [Patescibacteria group bacterium]